jgi:hypothetical protein
MAAAFNVYRKGNMDDIRDEQMNRILDTIRERLKPAEYYQQLIDLVDKMAAINTKMTLSQDEIKGFINEISNAIQNIIMDNNQLSDSIQSGISQMKDLDVVECNLIHKDLRELLRGDKHNLMEMIESFNKEGVVDKISGFISFIKGLVIVAAILSTISGVVAFFIWIAPKIHS